MTTRWPSMRPSRRRRSSSRGRADKRRAPAGRLRARAATTARPRRGHCPVGGWGTSPSPGVERLCPRGRRRRLRQDGGVAPAPAGPAQTPDTDLRRRVGAKAGPLAPLPALPRPRLRPVPGARPTRIRPAPGARPAPTLAPPRLWPRPRRSPRPDARPAPTLAPAPVARPIHAAGPALGLRPSPARPSAVAKNR